MPTTRVIKTATDFGAMLGAESYTLSQLISPPPEVESEVRGIVDSIFADLQYIDSNERELVSAYLDGIAEPLKALQAIGLQLVAINTTGKMSWPEGIPDPLGQEGPTEVPWTQTAYFVAPRPCLYRPDGDELVHVLGVACDGETGLLEKDRAIAWWGSREVVEQTFEGSVPWCNTCFLHAPAVE